MLDCVELTGVLAGGRTGPLRQTGTRNRSPYPGFYYFVKSYLKRKQKGDFRKILRGSGIPEPASVQNVVDERVADPNLDLYL